MPQISTWRCKASTNVPCFVDTWLLPLKSPSIKTAIRGSLLPLPEAATPSTATQDSPLSGGIRTRRCCALRIGTEDGNSSLPTRTRCVIHHSRDPAPHPAHSLQTISH